MRLDGVVRRERRRKESTYISQSPSSIQMISQSVFRLCIQVHFHIRTQPIRSIRKYNERLTLCSRTFKLYNCPTSKQARQVQVQGIYTGRTVVIFSFVFGSLTNSWHLKLPGEQRMAKLPL